LIGAMTKVAQPVVFVAVLTYRRPEMLAQLLRSLTTLERPVGWDVRVMIVDNDPEGSARPIVEAMAPQFGRPIDYVVEPEPGIPAARNRALNSAIDGQARLLCFLDDDDFPDPAWLREIVVQFHATGAVLIGGPMRLLSPEYATSRWERFLARSLVARSEFMERLSARRARRGTIAMVGSGNWMADVAWVQLHGLRFDAALRVSGGADGAFFFETQARGGKISWCERAIVYECLPRERLSLRYQLKRARDQGIVLTRLRREPPVRTYIQQSTRMLIGVGLMIFPAFGVASFALGTRMLAGGLGRIAGLHGGRSTLYARRSMEMPD
jgi:succinoglycan biosynthesis protein ExoM